MEERHIDLQDPKETEKYNSCADLMYQFLGLYSDRTMEKRDYGAGEATYASDVYILSYIVQHPGDTVSGIADHYSRTRSFICQVVSRLSEHGYVEKHPSEQDARSLHLYPTEKGLQMNEIHMRCREKITQGIFAEIARTCSKEDVISFFKVVNACVDIMHSQK